MLQRFIFLHPSCLPGLHRLCLWRLLVQLATLMWVLVLPDLAHGVQIRDPIVTQIPIVHIDPTHPQILAHSQVKKAMSCLIQKCLAAILLPLMRIVRDLAHMFHFDPRMN